MWPNVPGMALFADDLSLFTRACAAPRFGRWHAHNVAQSCEACS
jgi:hypothetical protein